jgi:hypothetical protein
MRIDSGKEQANNVLSPHRRLLKRAFAILASSKVRIGDIAQAIAKQIYR